MAGIRTSPKRGFAVAGLLAGFYLLHRWGSRLGATGAEVERSLPGDDILPTARYVTNHALTINAPPAAVWPWLAQVGYHRGGWYGNDTIDRLLVEHFFRRFASPGKEPVFKASAETILPQFQQLEVGDIVPDGPPDTAYFLVKDVAPARRLVLYSDTHLRQMGPPFLDDSRWTPRGDFTWTFVLEESLPGRTRLLLRMRANVAPAWLLPLLWPVLLAGETIFPFLLLRGVKRRAERLSSYYRFFLASPPPLTGCFFSVTDLHTIEGRRRGCHEPEQTIFPTLTGETT